MDEIHQLNTKVLMDEDSAEYRMESILLEVLADGAQRYDTLRKMIVSQEHTHLAESDFDALIYAMRKQKLVDVIGDLIQLQT